MLYNNSERYSGDSVFSSFQFAVLIVFCFLVCWAPVNISNIISDLGRSQPGSFSAPLTESKSRLIMTLHMGLPLIRLNTVRFIGMSGIENGGQGGVGLWHLATRVGTDSN